MSRGKLLILSHAFFPSVGGIETVNALLARGLSQRGHSVTVITNSLNNDSELEEPFKILRSPGMKALISEIGKADLVLQGNISLNLAWPLWVAFPRKPFILVHHTLISRPDGRLAWQDRLKRMLLWRPRCLSVSQFLAGTIAARSEVICNPYDSSTFRIVPGQNRDSDLLFVGRLVTAKGVDVLLRAFARVLQDRPGTELSIVGCGPEEDSLRRLALSLGVQQNARFLGPKRPAEIASLMNRHKLLVVPSRSRPPEALPVVPLEAIACGCVPVASRVGGLPESVGSAGVLVGEGSHVELATALVRLLNTPQLLDELRACAEAHLSRFRPDAVLDAYESHFSACLT